MNRAAIAAALRALASAIEEPDAPAPLAIVAAPAGVAFMSRAEYANHARISVRSLDEIRARMTEGLHFSRAGRRVRFHVSDADAFMRGHRAPAPPADDIASLALLHACRARSPKRAA